MNICLGLWSFQLGPSILSFHWAIQPGSLPIANITGASAVSDQNEFYMYLRLFLSQNSEKQYYLQPKSCT